MRARTPDKQGILVRDGVRIGYEVFGDGDPTILLMPSWTIFHSRFWKAQVPYLARHYRVITFDGPGNGLSDSTTDPAHYSILFYVASAMAVLDECGIDRAVVVGLSQGAEYTVAFAGEHPERVLGVALIGAALGIAPRSAERVATSENFMNPYPADPEGWEKYNLAYWHDHYEDFIGFFMNEIFSEPHSTKQFDDAVEWGLETTPAILDAESHRPNGVSHHQLLEAVRCPVLAIHGSDDHIIPHQVSVEIARITGGRLHTMEGSGHNPLARDPVHVNLLLRDFIEEVKP